jgi:hypothetical protein
MRFSFLALSLRTGIVCTGIIVGTTALQAAKPEPGEVEQAMEAEGPRAVVNRLWNSGDYEEVLRRMAAGDKRWVALAPALAQGADAAAAEGLSVALAQALPHNAEGVLRVLDPSRRALSPERVCGVPFVEGTDIDIPSFLAEATAAVSAVSSDRLQPAKAACLAELRQ